MKKILFSILILSLSLNSYAEEKLRLVASIKPLQLMAQELLGDKVSVDVLIPDGASPHYYALKPSDRRKLAEADLIIWVGPQLETFLEKPLNSYKGTALQLLHSDISTDDHHSHETEASADHHHTDHHDHSGSQDPHIWMDPVLMTTAAKEIKQTLVAKFPQMQPQLDARFQQFKEKTMAVDKVIQKQLQPYQQRGFVVFHDAFALLIEHYGLNQLAYFTVDPSRAPGAKTVARIQGLIKKEQAVCVFSEPQFEAEIVKRITSGMTINQGQLDPLAVAITTEQGYTGFLRNLADNIEQCLQ